LATCRVLFALSPSPLAASSRRLRLRRWLRPRARRAPSHARHFGALVPAGGADLSGFQPFAVDGKALRGTFPDDGAAGVALVGLAIGGTGAALSVGLLKVTE
jgi:hypothetical protein